MTAQLDQQLAQLHRSSVQTGITMNPLVQAQTIQTGGGGGVSEKNEGNVFRASGSSPGAHAQEVMRRIPATSSRATRRQIAQLMVRVLNLAVYPMELIAVSPLPRGFLPKVGKRIAFGYLYPAEDAALLGALRSNCRSVSSTASLLARACAAKRRCL
jgi:hypothetical protein